MAVVYRHIRNDTNEVFYVGIGRSEKRAYNKYDRSKLWKKFVKEYGYTVEIIKTSVTWKNAQKFERFFINKYGRLDNDTGTLLNRNGGGAGSSKQSQKTIKKRVESYKTTCGKNREARQLTREEKIKSEQERGTKVCKRCKVKKLLSEFYLRKTHNKYIGVVQLNCKICYLEKATTVRKKNESKEIKEKREEKRQRQQTRQRQSNITPIGTFLIKKNKKNYIFKISQFK